MVCHVKTWLAIKPDATGSKSRAVALRLYYLYASWWSRYPFPIRCNVAKDQRLWGQTAHTSYHKTTWHLATRNQSLDTSSMVEVPQEASVQKIKGCASERPGKSVKRSLTDLANYRGCQHKVTHRPFKGGFLTLPRSLTDHLISTNYIRSYLCSR